ncbi:hypothetical protein [Flavobacterium sp.]|uniref:hypothetical protein n=1 Tax=Flavobacterium sp. TaxID=239 RepID=UPI00333E8787
MLLEKYGIRKEFSSRYTDKGNEVEDLSIALVNEVLNYKFIYKNDEHFSNDWVTGTPDVNTDEVLIDVKSSWDASTFPFFETELPNKDYFYQLQGYMWLTGKTESVLAYCLIDTPLEMVEDEVRRAHWKLHLIEENTEVRNEIESKHKFSHIPNNRRVKYWFVQRDESVIEQIKERVELCREYYNLLMKTI